MLKVHAKKMDSIEVLSLEGQIVSGETEVLRKVVQLASDTGELILNFSNVSVVDAHGLGVLLQLREETLARGIHFELINVSRPLYRIFELARLNTVFEISSDVAFIPMVAYSHRVPVAA
jgi:anti-anti-sigma factor